MSDREKAQAILDRLDPEKDTGCHEYEGYDVIDTQLPKGSIGLIRQLLAETAEKFNQ